MDSRDLSRDQWEWLHNELGASARRLLKLYDHIEDRRFPPDDELLLLVREAYHAALRASHHAHSMRCQGSMGTAYMFRGEDGCGRTTPACEDRPK